MLWAARREQMSDTLGGMWASAVVVLQNGMQWNECPFVLLLAFSAFYP